MNDEPFAKALGAVLRHERQRAGHAATLALVLALALALLTLRGLARHGALALALLGLGRRKA